MYLNGIYICNSWYSKICWFSVKKCWCQQNSRGVSCDSYSFWIFYGQGITVPCFIIVGYVWQILGRETFLRPSHPWTARKNSILNRLKSFHNFPWIFMNTISLGMSFKEVGYNYSAHRSSHLFIIAISNHSYITRKWPQIFFL